MTCSLTSSKEFVKNDVHGGHQHDQLCVKDIQMVDRNSGCIQDVDHLSQNKNSIPKHSSQMINQAIHEEKSYFTESYLVEL